MKLRMGIAGAGFAAGLHIANLGRDPRAEIAAIYDLDPARRGDWPAASYDELLDRSDAVYITAPNTTHTDLALRALAAGKHVFCEKPMATNLDDARRVLDAARASQCVFQVGHNRRFAPVYKRVKELVTQSPPHTAHIKMNRGELLKPAWTGDDSVTGGFLYETPIHMFDMMRFLFGEITSLDARLSRPNDFSLLIEFASGMNATFVTSADAGWFFPYERLEVFGEYSTLETAEIESLSYRLGLDAETLTEEFGALPLEQRFGFEEEDRRFLDAVLSGAAPPVTALDGYRSVELVCACYQSAAERRAVQFGVSRAG
jgi:myo-inositol 2-dehydrogenase/D-chiro-inositol 1-dehydrogenase